MTRALRPLPAPTGGDFDTDHRGLPRTGPELPEVLRGQARACDAVAGQLEHVERVLSAALVDLLAGNTGAAGAGVAAARRELSAATSVCGEQHGDLDELAHRYDIPTGAQ